MASQEEVESFLRLLKEKIPVFDIAFRTRPKNLQVLADLDITSNDRKKEILGLTYKDYCSGPTKDTEVYGTPDYYVFGKIIKGFEVYIKLNLGKPGKMVDCISFHPAEFPLDFPLKPDLP